MAWGGANANGQYGHQSGANYRWSAAYLRWTTGRLPLASVIAGSTIPEGDMLQILRSLAGALLISSSAIYSSALAEPLPPLESIMTAKERQLFSDATQNRLVKLDPGQRQDI